jgi:hypothetical protein
MCFLSGGWWKAYFLTDSILRKLLEALFLIDNSIFPKCITILATIREVYHVFCSFWGGSDSRALSQDVLETDVVNVINRWA